ncbi:MAG: exodeoxyribonuclease V subunit alpha [Wenzhouxiangellaceae bacterium]
MNGPSAWLDDLSLWRRLGWLEAIDVEWARFLARLDSGAPPELLVAAALVSRQLGSGHVCLPLAHLDPADPGRLGLPPEHQRDDPSAAEALTRLCDWLERIASVTNWHASALIGRGACGNAPLVLDRNRLYLRRSWRAETGIAHAIIDRVHRRCDVPDATRVRELLQQLFGAGDGEPDWQRVACAIAAREHLCIITGGPGTGKTWTVVRIIAMLEALWTGDHPLRLQLAAPTGKAAQRLTEAMAAGWGQLADRLPSSELRAPPPATTLHRLLGARSDTRKFRHHRRNPLPADVVIVDEASMIDQELMFDLLDALAPGARLILLGDKDQLASVEAGAVFGELCRDADIMGYSAAQADWLSEVVGAPVPAQGPGGFADRRVVLRRNYRAGAAIHELAQAVNAGDAGHAAALLEGASGALGWVRPAGVADPDLERLLLHGASESSADGAHGCLKDIRAMVSALDQTPDPAAIDACARACLDRLAQFQVLCALRNGPWGATGLNRLIEERLAGVGRHRADADCWYHGRPVIVTRNDYATGLMNGDIGLCLELPGHDRSHAPGGRSLQVVFGRVDGSLRYLSPARVGDCESAWALTVHKAQGSEFGHAVLVLPDHPSRVLTRELVYTGLTRSRERFTLVCADRAVLAGAIECRTERAAALAERLAQADAGS